MPMTTVVRRDRSRVAAAHQTGGRGLRRRQGGMHGCPVPPRARQPEATMGRKKVDASVATLTSLRAARLYRLLLLLGNGAQTRGFLLRRLRIDIRGFYRDVEALRTLGIEVIAGEDTKYTLAGNLDDALEKLPFP